VGKGGEKEKGLFILLTVQVLLPFSLSFKPDIWCTFSGKMKGPPFVLELT
jgi:hypothetical protein